MTDTIKGVLEKKDIKEISFEYDANDESLILNIHVGPGIINTLSKNMAKPREKLKFPSLTFINSSVNLFE